MTRNTGVSTKRQRLSALEMSDYIKSTFLLLLLHQVWWHKPLTPAFRRQGRWISGFRENQNYTEKLSWNTKERVRRQRHETFISSLNHFLFLSFFLFWGVWGDPLLSQVKREGGRICIKAETALNNFHLEGCRFLFVFVC